MMAESPTASPLFERVEFPVDPALPQLASLFDPDQVWRLLQNHTARRQEAPRRIRIDHFIHRIGRQAVVSYELEWPPDLFLPSEYFVASIRRDGACQVSRYPDDERLPGLAAAARPETALRLVNDHVLTLPARRARVQLIRYRPAYRAVLRHRIDRAKLYARVVRPSDFEGFLAAYRASAQSGFVVPGLAGRWAAGGVLWFAEVRGQNLRRLVRKGQAPAPDRLLDGLERLWRASPDHTASSPFDLGRAYRRAWRSFRHNLRDFDEAARHLQKVVKPLNAFVYSWRPTGLAHNDFYDDQMIVLPDGRVALVDFEAIALGDPMLDVGNFLAHLRWSARFARSQQAENCRGYHNRLRNATLARFGWQEQSLAWREAVCLFRVCTNAIRHPKADWRRRLEAGLALVSECMTGNSDLCYGSAADRHAQPNQQTVGEHPVH